jgi:transposase-like protein
MNHLNNHQQKAPKERRKYNGEFKRQAVQLALSREYT